MGLLRRPTTSEIVEGGRLGRPAGRARYRASPRKPVCGYAAIPQFNIYGRRMRIEDVPASNPYC
jgi:hypothetical protein